MLATDRNRSQPERTFAEAASSVLSRMRDDSEELFRSAAGRISGEVKREAVALRDGLQSYAPEMGGRAGLKLSFVWTQDIAEVFRHVFEDQCARVGVFAPALTADLDIRARSVASVLGAPEVSVDLLCTRFAPGKAPIHVDYHQYLRGGCVELNPNHRCAFSFVMPYVGEGTQYLVHERALIERYLRKGVLQYNGSDVGIGHILKVAPEAQGLVWIKTGADSFTFHRNGVALHRAPSSSEFRILLAIDACLEEHERKEPLQALHVRAYNNSKTLRKFGSMLR